MNVWAWWPHTRDERIASYRLRCLQIVERLRSDGISAGLWSPGQSAPHVLVLSKRYDRDSVATAVQQRQRHGSRLVLDLCDNHFFHSGDNPAWVERRQVLQQAVSQMDMVVASTEVLAQAVRDHCPSMPPIRVIGDAAEAPADSGGASFLSPHGLALQRLRWRLRRVPRSARLVWFGNHGSGYADGGMSDLAAIRQQLEAANARTPLHLTVVSNSRSTYHKVMAGWALPHTYVAWHRRTISDVLRLHGTCLIPIRPNPFTLAKTSNRVATALLHGLWVIADAIPSYEEFRPFIALDDWNGGLRDALDGGEDLRRRREAGLAHVLRHHGIDAVAAQWRHVLSEAAVAPSFDARQGPLPPVARTRDVVR